MKVPFVENDIQIEDNNIVPFSVRINGVNLDRDELDRIVRLVWRDLPESECGELAGFQGLFGQAVQEIGEVGVIRIAVPAPYIIELFNKCKSELTEERFKKELDAFLERSVYKMLQKAEVVIDNSRG